MSGWRERRVMWEDTRKKRRRDGRQSGQKMTNGSRERRRRWTKKPDGSKQRSRRTRHPLQHYNQGPKLLEGNLPGLQVRQPHKLLFLTMSGWILVVQTIVPSEYTANALGHASAGDAFETDTGYRSLLSVSRAKISDIPCHARKWVDTQVIATT